MNPVLPLIAAILVLAPALRAAAPFLKPNDVIALVGGEDMVAASEYGYLELLLQRALPEHRLKVRSLAWEGDTVFEQPRDLNYPTLEAQLDEVGATAVIMQFGQMESLAGTSKLPEFIQAYEKLIERVSSGGKRRVVIVSPSQFVQPVTMFANETAQVDREKVMLTQLARSEDLRAYANAVPEIARKRDVQFFDRLDAGVHDLLNQRDGVHLDGKGHLDLGWHLARHIAEPSGGIVPGKVDEPLRQLIAAKNRLWFHYYRPQNWAFLAGDRTEQPSSRDHKDPSKRWFPEEMKQWLPLIDAKEKEIWALAAKASAK